VGQRVVVRRVLPGQRGPTGGPAFTDALGICERWDTSEGVALLRREDGSSLKIRIADVVSGKPVPPRPSVRMRVSAREAEEHALLIWPRLDIARLGDWVLRSDPLLTPGQRVVKRANSCLAMGSPGTGLVEALARVKEFYAERDRPALLQVETGSDIDVDAVALGWRPLPEGAATFHLASVARARRALPRDLPALDTVEDPGEVRVVARGVRARAVLDGDWLGIHDLAVDAAYRRRGLARAALAVLLDWGASRGALTAWLHVEVGNTAALALYEPLGFAAHHGYRYLAAPDGEDDGEAEGEAVGDAGTHSTAATGA
jgi:ribosomal protein S18 acetylase RimI-like enzyme